MSFEKEPSPSYKLIIQNSFLEYLARKQHLENSNEFIFEQWINNNRAKIFDYLFTNDPDFRDNLVVVLEADTTQAKEHCFNKALEMLDTQTLH